MTFVEKCNYDHWIGQRWNDYPVHCIPGSVRGWVYLCSGRLLPRPINPGEPATDWKDVAGKCPNEISACLTLLDHFAWFVSYFDGDLMAADLALAKLMTEAPENPKPPKYSVFDLVWSNQIEKWIQKEFKDHPSKNVLLRILKHPRFEQGRKDYTQRYNQFMKALQESE